MNARAFQGWAGRLALLALLLLATVPTATRLVHAAHGVGHGHAAVSASTHGHLGHEGHAARAVDPRPDGREPLRSAPGDADCDYCPLLASMLVSPVVLFFAGAMPPAPPARRAIGAPRLPWLHPTGLGSRGPPLHG